MIYPILKVSNYNNSVKGKQRTTALSEYAAIPLFYTIVQTFRSVGYCTSSASVGWRLLVPLSFGNIYDRF